MNIYNYIINFKNQELGEINTLDAIVLTRLSYIRFEEIANQLPIKIHDLWNYLETIHPNKLDTKLIKLLGESKRFRNLVITRCYHISDISKEEEFTAITILLPNRDKFVSYRGTSKKLYDFKEDMNMAFEEIPSSFTALKYLKEEKEYRHLYIGGHSKGGHLAMYAASHIGYFKRLKIIKVYNFDGPGFLEIDKSLNRIQNKIINYCPEDSIVGRIMLNPSPIIAIKTNKQGLEAHGLYHWKVENNDLVIGILNNKSNEFHHRCLSLLKTMSIEKRKIFINYLFLLMQKGEIKSIKELSITKIRLIINRAPHLSKEEKAELMKFFKVFIKCSMPKMVSTKNFVRKKASKKM